MGSEMCIRDSASKTSSGDGYYPLPRSLKCGLSSPAYDRSGRLAGPILQHHRDTKRNLNRERVSVRHADYLDSMGVVWRSGSANRQNST